VQLEIDADRRQRVEIELLQIVGRRLRITWYWYSVAAGFGFSP